MLQFLLLLSDQSNHDKILYLYHTFHDEMIRFAKYRLRHAGVPNCELDAEDVVQAVFVRITKYIAAIDFTVSEKELKAYVLKIVANEVIKHLTDQQHFEGADIDVETIEDGDFFERVRIRERYDRVMDIIEHMDEKYSIALSLRYKENMDVKDIAGLMGIAEKTVYTRIDRGRKLLVEALEKEM